MRRRAGEYAWIVTAGVPDTWATRWMSAGPNCSVSPGPYWTGRGPPRLSRSSSTRPRTTATAPAAPSWSWKPVSWPGIQQMSQTVTSSSRRSAWKVRWARSARTWGRQAASSAAKASATARSSVGVSVAMPRIYTKPIGNNAIGGSAARSGAALDSIAQPMISTNQFKNGNHIDVDGTVFKIVEFQHVKPGKGGAFVRTKLRRTTDGAVIDRTFRAGEKFRAVRTETRRMQFLYADGTDAHFMDLESYEQITVPEDQVKEPLKWVLPSEEVDVL